MKKEQNVLATEAPETPAPTQKSSNAKWTVKERGALVQFPIISAKYIDSLEKWVINEKFWCSEAPNENHRFITMQKVTIEKGEESRDEMNFVSFNAAEAAKKEDELVEKIISAPTDGKAQALAMFFGSRR